MHGFVDEQTKARLYRQAWLHVTASTSEGWSLTVMEAALCGTPSAAIAVGGLRESIVDGETGVLANSIRRPGPAGRAADLRRRAARAARRVGARAGAHVHLGPDRVDDARSFVARWRRRRLRRVSRRIKRIRRCADAGRRCRGLADRRAGASLYDAAQAVGPGGRIVEIGSFRGRSTIILARRCPRVSS